MRRIHVLECPELPSWMGWGEAGRPICNLEAPEVTASAVCRGRGGYQHGPPASESELDSAPWPWLAELHGTCLLLTSALQLKPQAHTSPSSLPLGHSVGTPLTFPGSALPLWAEEPGRQGLHRDPTSPGEGRQPDRSSVGLSGCEQGLLAGPQSWQGRQTGALRGSARSPGLLAEVSWVKAFPDHFLPRTPTSRVESITAPN